MRGNIRLRLRQPLAHSVRARSGLPIASSFSRRLKTRAARSPSSGSIADCNLTLRRVSCPRKHRLNHTARKPCEEPLQNDCLSGDFFSIPP